MGEVSGEGGEKNDVFVKVHHDGSTIDRGRGGVEVIIDEAPSGIRRKTGSPQETLTPLGGKPPQKLNVDVGAFRATITNGSKIRFHKIERQKRIARNTKSLVTSRNGRTRGKLLR